MIQPILPTPRIHVLKIKYLGLIPCVDLWKPDTGRVKLCPRVWSLTCCGERLRDRFEDRRRSEPRFAVYSRDYGSASGEGGAAVEAASCRLSSAACRREETRVADGA